MRVSTASLIAFFVAALAVQAGPIEPTSPLSLRPTGLSERVEATGIHSGLDLEARDPNRNKYMEYASIT